MLTSRQYPVSVMRRRALAESFTRVSKMGMTTGKPMIAMRVALLLALAAIAAMNVNAIEKPTLPKNNISAKRPTSLTMFSVKKDMATKVSMLMSPSKSVLYNIFERMIAVGCARV